MDAQEEHDLWIISNPLQTYKGNPEMIKQFKAENAQARAKASLRSGSIPAISLVEEVMASYQVSRDQAQQMLKDFGA